MLVLWYFLRERLFDVEWDFLCNFCVNISRFEEFDKPTYLGFFNAQYDGHQMTFSWLETLFKINNLGKMYQDSIYHNICISNCLSHYKPLLLWWYRCTSMWWYCIGKWGSCNLLVSEVWSRSYNFYFYLHRQSFEILIYFLF